MRKAFLILIFCWSLVDIYAQDLTQQASQKETDSLVAETTQANASELSLRINYLNRALSYGRDFGLNQSALTATATYYHKTGLFGSVAGFWYSGTDPNYSLTLLSLGYNGELTEDWTYSLSYDRFFFNPNTSGLIQNGLNAYTNYDFGYWNVSANYGYAFGEENLHNLSLNIAGYAKIKDVGFIDKITFMPNISALLGTESVPLGRFTQTQFERAYQRPWVQRRLQNRNPNRPIPQPIVQTQEQQVFGLMAWNFAIPVRFAVNNFRLGITWNYIIPVQLPNEDYNNLSPSSFWNISLGYTIR
ncbi:MAG: hypothetical protein MUE81_12655 [Thermoflexibacter sp.]|nr:hypothetical protein [Thermoflexibacter sp.]